MEIVIMVFSIVFCLGWCSIYRLIKAIKINSIIILNYELQKQIESSKCMSYNNINKICVFYDLDLLKFSNYNELEEKTFYELTKIYSEKKEMLESSNLEVAVKKVVTKKILLKAVRKKDYTIKIKNSTFTKDELQSFDIETKDFNEKYNKKIRLLVEIKKNTVTIFIFGRIRYNVIDELADILSRQTSVLWIILYNTKIQIIKVKKLP